MGTIAILDQNTIDKIAAGEVVERPASVVKELVENAMDAGATAITVEIREGGISFIRITDNGSGIPSDQVPAAFWRHATSKLRTVEELVGIASMGFRGEALSSIAAVSQVEMITKTADALTGTRYVIEGGTEKEKEEVGAPGGTTFLVRNLFYNTPARKKFLRTPVTEANAVTSVVEQLALSHPGISFKYMVNNQTKLHTSGNRNQKELVYNIYGREIARELIEVHSESPLLSIDGFIGKPVISRGNRNFENYYVNGRYVRSKLLAKAIEDGYHTAMMQHKYPFTLLYIQMDGEAVDVNVHPTKMELRFSRQEEIYDQVTAMIAEALHKKEQVVRVSLSSEEKKEEKGGVSSAEGIPEPFEQMRKHAGNQGKASTIAEEPAPYLLDTMRKENLAKDRPVRSLPIWPERAGRGMSSPAFLSGQAGRSMENGLTPEEEALFASDTDRNRETLAAAPSPDTVADTKKMAEGKSLKPSGEQTAPNTAEENAGESKPNTEIFRGLETRPAAQDQGNPNTAENGLPVQMELFDHTLLTPQARQSSRIIGQVFDTYWLVEYDDCLYIIDQHAAHEKVLFERMMENYRKKEILSQMVRPPLVVSLTSGESELINRYHDLFTAFGYEIEPFGGKDYAISAVPHNLYGIATEDLFVELLDHLEDVGDKPLDIVTERLATMSCKAAVKGNQRLSGAEVEQLIGELLTLDDPYHCPHGRPTIISLSQRELEKKFKRIV